MQRKRGGEAERESVCDGLMGNTCRAMQEVSLWIMCGSGTFNYNPPFSSPLTHLFTTHSSDNLLLNSLMLLLIDTLTPNTFILRLALRYTTVTYTGLVSRWGRGRDMQT